MSFYIRCSSCMWYSAQSSAGSTIVSWSCEPWALAMPATPRRRVTTAAVVFMLRLGRVCITLMCEKATVWSTWSIGAKNNMLPQACAWAGQEPKLPCRSLKARF